MLAFYPLKKVMTRRVITILFEYIQSNCPKKYCNLLIISVYAGLCVIDLKKMFATPN